MTSDEILENLVEECHADHVGLWEIVTAVQLDLGSKDPGETKALTLQLVGRLLGERGMQVGHPAPDGRHFIAWDLPAEEAVNRIEQEWSALGREPNIGEVAWLTSAPKAPNPVCQPPGHATHGPSNSTAL
jgi:hypothetical protein